MKIAIIGPAGSGKTTIARELTLRRHFDTSSGRWLGSDLVYLNCDKCIQETYDKMTGLEVDYINKVYPAAIDHTLRCLDKNILGTFLAHHPKERTHLENLFFKSIRSIIEKYENVIVDGLLPRFLKKIKFDYVLYVHTDKKERRQRLLNRGVSKKRIKEIESMQKDMFREPI